MDNFSSALAGISFATLIGIIFGYIRLKRHLKEEIVDPDVKRLEEIIKDLKEDFDKRIAKVEGDGMRMSDKLDHKFAELNDKLDRNSHEVSTMKGMLTAIFNGLRNGSEYGQ